MPDCQKDNWPKLLLVPLLSLRGVKPTIDLRIKAGQRFDELKLLFTGLSDVSLARPGVWFVRTVDLRINAK
jgi:hypothetical protein